MYKRAVLACGLAAVALSPLPAHARAASRDAGLAEMADRLGDPELQHSFAGVLVALSDALLGMKVAPMARAAAAMGDSHMDGHMDRRIGPNTTLRDLAGPDARNLKAGITEKVPQMMSAMAGMTGAMQAILPQLEAMAEQMKGRLDEAGIGDSFPGNPVSRD
jgi:hypothetical protein